MKAVRSLILASALALWATGAVSQSIGTVQVCKVAGSGILTGTNFSFNVAGTAQTIGAGPAPAGACGAPVAVPAGNAVVSESIPANTVLTGVTASPSGSLVSSNLAAGTATVTVVGGSQTTVTFTDTSTLGTVRACKVAGAGILTGTSFSFNVAGTVQNIGAGAAPTGACGTPVSVPAGNVVVTETVPANVVLTGVATSPSAGLLVSSNLADSALDPRNFRTTAR